MMNLPTLLRDTVAHLQEGLGQVLREEDAQARLALSAGAFEGIRCLFEAQDVWVREASQAMPYAANAFLPALRNRDAVLDIMEKAVMMHVDEPFHAYAARVAEIQPYLATFAQPGYLALVSEAEAYLDAAAQARILALLAHAEASQDTVQV
jgi:hypothetical protein